MIVELKRLHSPDVYDLQVPSLEDPENFCILVQAFVGPKEEFGPGGEPAEESFDFTVCTPRWMTEYLSQNTFLFGRHHLFLNHYDYNVIWERITKLCETAQGSSWDEIAERLSRYGHWEFEDYKS